MTAPTVYLGPEVVEVVSEDGAKGYEVIKDIEPEFVVDTVPWNYTVTNSTVSNYMNYGGSGSVYAAGGNAGYGGVGGAGGGAGGGVSAFAPLALTLQEVLHVTLAPDMAKRIEAARGGKSALAFVLDAVEEALAWEEEA